LRSSAPRSDAPLLRLFLLYLLIEIVVELVVFNEPEVYESLSPDGRHGSKNILPPELLSRNTIPGVLVAPGAAVT
jgi:hypothetical protein